MQRWPPGPPGFGVSFPVNPVIVQAGRKRGKPALVSARTLRVGVLGTAGCRRVGAGEGCAGDGEVLGMERCWGQLGAGEGRVLGKDGCCRRTGTAEGWEAAATKPGSAMGNKSSPKPHTLAAGRGGQEEREVPGVVQPRRRWHSGPDLPFRMASPASPRAGCGKQGARAEPRPPPANPT